MSLLARKQYSVPGRTIERPASETARLRPAAAPAIKGSGVSMTERVQRRAYEIFCARNITGRAGDQVSDWLEAERELRAVTPEPKTTSEVTLKHADRGNALLAQGN